MSVSRFVNELKTKAKESLNAQIEIKSIHDLESALTIQKLNTLISEYENDTSRVTKEKLRDFTDLLANRWEQIKDSDAIEQYTDSAANNACRQLAIAMATELKTSSAKLLMPTLVDVTYSPDTNRSTRTNKNKAILTLSPSKYVLSDDNRHAIILFNCLKAGVNENGKLRHTANSAKDSLLTDAEMKRVVEHDSETQAIFKLVKNKKTIKADLEHQLAAYKLQKLTAQSAYGKEGEARLIQSIYADLNDFGALVNKLNSLPKNLWKPFCAFIPKEYFNLKAVGYGDKPDLLAEPDGIFTDINKKNEAAMYVLFECYHRHRNDGYYYGSYGIAGLFTGQHKGNKLSSTSKMQDMLIDESMSLEGIADKLKNPDNEISQHVKYLNNGTLNKLASLFVRFESPEIEEKLVESKKAS